MLRIWFLWWRYLAVFIHAVFLSQGVTVTHISLFQYYHSFMCINGFYDISGYSYFLLFSCVWHLVQKNLTQGISKHKNSITYPYTNLDLHHFPQNSLLCDLIFPSNIWSCVFPLFHCHCYPWSVSFSTWSLLTLCPAVAMEAVKCLSII